MRIFSSAVFTLSILIGASLSPAAAEMPPQVRNHLQEVLAKPEYSARLKSETILTRLQRRLMEYGYPAIERIKKWLLARSPQFGQGTWMQAVWDRLSAVFGGLARFLSSKYALIAALLFIFLLALRSMLRTASPSTQPDSAEAELEQTNLQEDPEILFAAGQYIEQVEALRAILRSAMLRGVKQNKTDRELIAKSTASLAVTEVFRSVSNCFELTAFANDEVAHNTAAALIESYRNIKSSLQV